METRRTEIAQALLRLVAQGGFEAVSMRTVAKEARLSLGMVQRHFASKEEMLHFAMEHVVREFEKRFSQAYNHEKTPKELVLLLLRLLVEVSPATQGELRVWLSLVHQSVSHSEYTQYPYGHYNSILELLQKLLPEPKSSNAHLLLALTDGLTIQRLLGSISHEDAILLLEQQINLIF